MMVLEQESQARTRQISLFDVIDNQVEKTDYRNAIKKCVALNEIQSPSLIEELSLNVETAFNRYIEARKHCASGIIDKSLRQYRLKQWWQAEARLRREQAKTPVIQPRIIER
mgnify:FL=1